MSQRIKLDTLKEKIEHMIQAMNGPPDHEENYNNQLLENLNRTTEEIKVELKDCQEKLVERVQRTDPEWQTSKDRILLDEAIKAIFVRCEEKLASLRRIFKEY